MAFLPKHKSPEIGVVLTEEQLEKIFKKHDKNGDGQLNKAEVAEAFKQMGAIFSGWRAFWAMFNADSNSDGVITRDEIEGLVNYARKQGFTVQGVVNN